MMHLQKLDSQSARRPKAAPASLTGKASPAAPADLSDVDAGSSVLQWINRVSEGSNETEPSGPVTVGQGKLHYTMNGLACPEWVSCGLPKNGYHNGLFQFVQKDRSDKHWVCWLCSKGDKRVDKAHLHSITHAKRLRGDGSDYSAEEWVAYHLQQAEV